MHTDGRVRKKRGAYVVESLSREILTFWFGTADLSVEMEKRQVWFRATPEFDRHLVDHYTRVHERAAAGELDHFRQTPEDCLTLVMALDQFPRNIHRGTARAFSTDAMARAVAEHALERGHDRGLSRWPRTFFYLPFEHSERMVDQERALALYRTLGNEESLRAAVGHHDAIRRFGRFPHRNAVLGRPNTPEEEAYLKDPPLWGKTATEAAELEARRAEAGTGEQRTAETEPREQERASRDTRGAGSGRQRPGAAVRRDSCTTTGRRAR